MSGKAYLSVCAIYRDEAPYLREWIEFHRLAGVERFFLYDNLSEDDHLEALSPYLDDGSVVLHEWTLFPGQQQAYDDCVVRHREDSRWIAFIDLDEFLFSPTGQPLPDLLPRYEGWAGLGVNRVWFGMSGHRTKPEGMVIESYTATIPRRPDKPPAIKSVIDPKRTIRRYNAHAFLYEEGEHAVDEEERPIEGWVTEDFCSSLFRVNHYFTKSEEECRRKFATPQAGTGQLRPSTPNFEAWHRRELDAEHDDVILQYVPALREALERTARRRGEAVGGPSSA